MLVIVETIIALTKFILFLKTLLRIMKINKLITANMKGVKQETKILKMKSLSANMFMFVSSSKQS